MGINLHPGGAFDFDLKLRAQPLIFESVKFSGAVFSNYDTLQMYGFLLSAALIPLPPLKCSFSKRVSNLVGQLQR